MVENDLEFTNKIRTMIIETCEKDDNSINEQLEEIEENVTTHHVTITTERLKELIKNNYKWNDYNLQGKIDIVTHLVYFENDRELLEFLLYMEGKENV